MISKKDHTKLSKFLSFVLRHSPERIGIELDRNGWTNISTLLEKMNNHGKTIDRETLNFIVANNNKKRYSIDEEKNKIRASKGIP